MCILSWAGGGQAHRRQQSRNETGAVIQARVRWVAACTGRWQWSWENETDLHGILEVALPGRGCEFHVEGRGGVKDESQFLGTAEGWTLGGQCEVAPGLSWYVCPCPDLL